MDLECAMDLIEGTYTADFAGRPQLVIEDGPLLDLARENRTTPGNVQIEALQNGIIPLRYLKNFHALSFTEQIRICKSKVLICGCGGLGGILISLLARAGVGLLRLVDGDVFVPSNLNRQLLCDSGELARSKAQVAAERVKAVNPLIEVEAFSEAMDDHNAKELIQGTDLVLDALDNLSGRFTLAYTARRLGIPFIHAAVAGWWGQLATFLPESTLDLKSVYGDRLSRDSTEDWVGVLGPTPAVIGSLQALEAIRILSGKRPAYAESLLYFDGESGRTEIMPL